MAYAGALMGTMLIFAVAIWTARRAGGYNDVWRYAFSEADLALNILRQAERAGQPVAVTRDSLVGPVIIPPLKTLLEPMPDYLVVLDSTQRILYLSPPVTSLDPDDQTQLMKEAVNMPITTQARVVTIGQQPLVFAVRVPSDPRSALSRVVVAAPPPHSLDTALRDLVETMLVTAPLLLIASIALAYVIAGRAFKPVDRIIDEVEAITDGRSLHRRLPVDGGGDEIARLAVTLNEMIERLAKSFGALRRFTADASHELKTPLAVLRA